MRINHLAFRNFKGFKGSYDLGPVTLVTGKNFSHKTSIPMAIRLALSGKLPPPIGVQGVYALAGNPDGQGDMLVELVLGERKVLWSWAKDAKGKVSVDGGVPADLAMPDMLLEPRLFWQKTAAERVKTIFSACNLDDVDFVGSITNRFREVQANPVALAEDILTEVQEKIRSLPSDPPQAFCGMLLDWLENERKRASSEAKTNAGAFIAFRVGDTGARPKDVSKELSEARDKLVGLQAKQRQTSDPNRRRYLEVALNDIKLLSQDEISSLSAIICPVDPEEIDDVLPDLMRGYGKAEKDFTESAVTIRDLDKRIALLVKAECCPTCGAKRKGWKEAALDDLQTQWAAAQKLNSNSGAARKAIDQQLLGIKHYQDAQKRLTANQESLAAKAKLQRELDGLVEAKPDPELSEQINALQCDIQVLENKQLQWSTYQSDLKKRDVLSTKQREYECRAEVCSQIKNIVTEEQGKLFDTAFAQVLKVAKYFTDGLLNSPLEFTKGELGRRVSQLDKDQGNMAPVGSWISHEVFSGTEELLAYAGFSVALAADAPVKIVMLDELGRLDPQRKVDITQRMLQLTSKGIIDQAILVDVSQKDYAGIAAQNKNLVVIGL